MILSFTSTLVADVKFLSESRRDITALLRASA